MGVHFAGEGLLDGLDGDARTARLELLERLEAEGAVAFADLVGFTRLGEEVPPPGARRSPSAWRRSRATWPTRPCGS